MSPIATLYIKCGNGTHLTHLDSFDSLDSFPLRILVYIGSKIREPLDWPCW